MDRRDRYGKTYCGKKLCSNAENDRVWASSRRRQRSAVALTPAIGSSANTSTVGTTRCSTSSSAVRDPIRRSSMREYTLLLGALRCCTVEHITWRSSTRPDEALQYGGSNRKHCNKRKSLQTVYGRSPTWRIFVLLYVSGQGSMDSPRHHSHSQAKHLHMIGWVGPLEGSEYP